MTLLESINEVIKNRRSCFTPMFTGGKVDDNLVWQMLENANWAPTHKLTEPWRFQVFTGDALQRLSEYQKQFYLSHTPEEKRTDRKLNKTINNALKSSHVIALILKTDELDRIPEWEELAALSSAVQNMWLTAAAAGIGCYWSTPQSALQANGFLELHPNEKCLGWFYIGVIKSGLELTSKRTPIEDKTKWITK